MEGRVSDGPRAPWSPGALADSGQEALGRLVIALNSALELDEVLEVVAGEILSSTGARRASVLLCAPDGKEHTLPTGPRSPGANGHGAGVANGHGRSTANGDGRAPAWLEPAVALARETDVGLWRVFQDSGRVELDEAQRAVFGRARAVPVADATDSPLIPAGWAERFGLESVVLVPLFAEGIPCGLLAVEYPRREAFEPPELALLESMGEHAGLAVLHARMYEQARRSARLSGEVARASLELLEPLDDLQISSRLATVMAKVLETDLVGVGRIRADGMLVPTVVTGGRPLPAPRPLAEVPARITEQVEATWREGVAEACELGPDPWLCELLEERDQVNVGGFVLLPLLAEGAAVGALLAAQPLGAGRLHPEVATHAKTLAIVGGQALERYREHADPKGARRMRVRLRGHLRLQRSAADNGPRLEPELLDRLTPRQLEVLDLLVDDLRNDQIAEGLCLSEHTVKSHVSAILTALEVSDRREAARVGRAMGLGPR